MYRHGRDVQLSVVRLNQTLKCLKHKLKPKVESKK